MKLTKAEKNENPCCPFCEKEINEIKTKQIDTGWLKMTEKYIYFCPCCQKVLGIVQSI
ncbi:MAG: hypothetical protein LRZ92_06675 [Methanosarcinaceae archaeon]|jgi:protein-disulfide isomerase|nr:hypothetical protein [Methanosarcinaceae archaeon]